MLSWVNNPSSSNQRVRRDANAFNIASLAGIVTASVATPSAAAVPVNTDPVTSTGNGTDGYTQYILTFAADVNRLHQRTTHKVRFSQAFARSSALKNCCLSG